MVRSAINKTHGKDYEDFGKKIAEARESRGLSQKEASQLLGIPQSTYAGYETGTRKIPLSLIKELSAFYGVSADQLLGNEIHNTIAAHLESENLTEDELKEIYDYIRFLKSKRKQE